MWLVLAHASCRELSVTLCNSYAICIFKYYSNNVLEYSKTNFA